MANSELDTKNKVSVPKDAKNSSVSVRDNRALYRRSVSAFRSVGAFAGGFSNIFYVIFFILFALMFYSYAFNMEQTYTFTGFLNAMSEVPQIDNSWIVNFSNLTIEGDWGLFDFFREFIINTSIRIISFLLYMVTGIGQLLVYIYYVVRTFLFIS